MFLESIKMSWENIVGNKLRSFLTMLGIVIGVASIIALITIVQAATNSISEKVNELGVNKVTVTAFGTPLKGGLNSTDMENIAHLSNVSGVSPTVSTRSGVTYHDAVIENVTISGKNEVYFRTDSSSLKAGRPISILDVEAKNNVAVIGDDVVQQLFYGQNPIGKDIVIQGISYHVIGLLEVTNSLGINSLNKSIVIPYTTAMRNIGVRNITSLDVYLKDTNIANDSVNDIKGVLSPAFNYNDDAYSVFNMGVMIDTFQQMMSMMQLLLSGIAAISLVVGGIGIMNMMLVSISERKMEIGLRKALGATPWRIQMQFIIESIFLSILGGIIGLILGVLIAYVAIHFIGVTFALTFSTISLALGFSAGVGIVFGFMPARKASRLNPIDALRSL